MYVQSMQDIEYLRQKASLSYEEAVTLLEENENNIIAALMMLENQGRLYPQNPDAEPKAEPQTEPQPQWQADTQAAAHKIKSQLQKASRHRLVLERKCEDGSRQTIVNLGMPVAVGAVVLAPYLAVLCAAAAVVTGCHVKIEKDDASQ